MEIRLSTLGTASVVRDGRELSTLPGKPVTFGLLVYLALEGTVTRDKAAAVFWPESDTERARANLSQTLYELKQDLGEEWLAKQGNLLLTRDPLWVDANALEDLLEEDRHEEAVSLYQGHFLDGVFLAQTHPFEEWVEHRRGELRRRHRDAIERFLEDCRVRGDLGKALARTSNWVRMDPLCESAQHNLIQLLAATGNRDEAVAQHERYRALLQEELGLEPLEETTELVKAIRSGRMKPIASESEGLSPPHSSWPGPLPAQSPGKAIAGRLHNSAEFQRYLEGELAPRLQVLRPVGVGSMARVFLARDPALRVLVAVKVLAPELTSNQEARLRFQREAEAMARLDYHPNVCGVKWAGSLSDQTPYLVMPFIKGITLAERVQAEGRLGPEEVRNVLLEVASALAAAHGAGIIHRDLRPDNVLRDEATGRNLLSDFGIAGALETGDFGGPKVTQTGEILGHPAYISPEQMDNKPLTDRSDIYSLGVTGYKLLTGHTPPPGEAAPKKAGRQAVSALEEYAQAFKPIDRRLVDLIIHCLAPNPGHRPTAADIEKKLKEDERERARGEPDSDRTFSPWEILWNKRLPQILGGYAAAAWMGLEASQYLVNKGLLSPVAESLVLATVPFGFVAVTILGWFHGRKGRQRMPAVEKWLLGVVGLAWLLTCLLVP